MYLVTVYYCLTLVVESNSSTCAMCGERRAVERDVLVLFLPTIKIWCSFFSFSLVLLSYIYCVPFVVTGGNGVLLDK
jgi:hypothetical protein